MVGLKAQFRVAHIDEAANEQSGSQQQCEAEGGLRDHEAVLEMMGAPAVRGALALFAQGFHGGDAGELPGRKEAAEQGGGDGDG